MFEVKVTVPKQLLDVKAFGRTLERGIDRLVNDSAQDIRSLTDGWNVVDRPVIIREDARHKGNVVEGAMYAIGEVLAFVNYGTPRHPIVPRNKLMLKFRDGRGYVRKTRPGILKTVGGGANTGDIIFKKAVDHPGIEVPRRWDMALAAKYGPRLADVAAEAIKEITK